MTAGREGRVAVTMPQLGETVAEGTVLRWLKKVGDEVADQEPLLEIATDKVDTEVPSPAGGVLDEIVVGEDETVDVGTVIAHLVPAGGSTRHRAEADGAARPAVVAEERSSSPPSDERSSPTPASDPPPTAPTAPMQPTAPAPRGATGPRHRHSPRVRRLARDSGVDLDAVTGTGPGGRVTPDDVAHIARQEVSDTTTVSPAALPTRSEPAAGGAAALAFRTVVAEVDVASSQWLTAGAGSAAAAAATPFVAAVAASLRSHDSLLAGGVPETGVDLAVSWSSGTSGRSWLLERADELNVGAVADRLGARGASAVEPGEGSFAVSFGQDAGVLFEVEAPPVGHRAALSFGAPTERVVVVGADGSPGIGIRLRSHVALSYDPVAVGRDSALGFLAEVVRRATTRS